jgi:phosphatidylglycerophosphatase A
MLATAGGAGYAPIAPGTAGSAVGVVAFALLVPFGTGLVLGVSAVLLAAGIWAADHAERVFRRKDDGRIVIDEVVGQLLTLAPLAALAPSVWPRSPWLLGAGFLIFRLFDIWKPGPVRLAERSFPGGTGVMLDDVVAGLLSAAVMTLLALALGGPS